MTEKAEWYVSDPPRVVNPILVEEDEHTQIVPYSFSLQFFYLRPYHEGIYNCKLKNDFDAPHFLHVLASNVEPMLEVRNSLSFVLRIVTASTYITFRATENVN